MVIYILLGFLAVVIIQLGMVISRLSTIQTLSHDLVISSSSRSSRLDSEKLQDILRELEKQSAELSSISGDVWQLNSPLQQFKKKREFDDHIQNVDLEDILK